MLAADIGNGQFAYLNGSETDRDGANRTECRSIYLQNFAKESQFERISVHYFTRHSHHRGGAWARGKGRADQGLKRPFPFLDHGYIS
jgi:hypothetical protein